MNRLTVPLLFAALIPSAAFAQPGPNFDFTCRQANGQVPAASLTLQGRGTKLYVNGQRLVGRGDLFTSVLFPGVSFDFFAEGSLPGVSLYVNMGGVSGRYYCE